MNIIVMRTWEVLARTKRAVVAWSWAPVAGRGLIWLGAFLALSHVGSGAAARLLEPRPPASASWASAGFAPGEVASAAPQRASPIASPQVTSEAFAKPSAQPSCHGGAGVTADGRVILNAADTGDLVRLPSVGRKRAAAIVALRAKLGGRFRRIEDLMRVRGIGYKLLKRLRPLVVLDPPPPEEQGTGGSADHDER